MIVFLSIRFWETVSQMYDIWVLKFCFEENPVLNLLFLSNKTHFCCSFMGIIGSSIIIRKTEHLWDSYFFHQKTVEINTFQSYNITSIYSKYTNIQHCQIKVKFLNMWHQTKNRKINRKWISLVSLQAYFLKFYFGVIFNHNRFLLTAYINPIISLNQLNLIH